MAARNVFFHRFLQSFTYLEQCAFGRVEFSVAVNHSFHYRRTISYHQQSGAPEKKNQIKILLPRSNMKIKVPQHFPL